MELWLVQQQEDLHCASGVSYCMLCAAPPPPPRPPWLRPPCSQSTPLLRAPPLTRWRGRFQQLVATRPLNPWPTRPKLTAARSRHTTGRWTALSRRHSAGDASQQASTIPPLVLWLRANAPPAEGGTLPTSAIQLVFRMMKPVLQSLVTDVSI